MLGTFPLFMGTVPQESVSAADGATATGLVVGVSQLAGGCLGPVIGGLLAGRAGLTAPLLLAGALAAAASLFALKIRQSD